MSAVRDPGASPIAARIPMQGRRVMKRNRLVRGAQLCLLSVALTCTDELVPTSPDKRGPTGDGGAVQFATSATDPSVIVWDTFSRNVAAGWGSADVGGAWYTQTSGSIFRVDGSRGVVTVPDTRSYKDRKSTRLNSSHSQI